MRISKIQQNLHFQAGRTQVYSDFDGTYFPFDQKILLESESHKEFIDYC